MIKVSIIIPIYNVEQYILSCLESVVKQTMTRDVECILVDDCGRDNSMDIAQQFVDSYKGNIIFSVLHHDQNKGLSAARNTGVNLAVGKYLYFLDSDDELTQDAIAKMYTLAERYHADLVQGCYISEVLMLTNFWEEMPEFTDDKGYIKRTMLDYDHFPIMAQNRLVRRDLVINNKLYFREGIIHEDNHWTFFLAKYINRLAVCGSSAYLYRSNPNSITAVKNIQKEALACKTYITDFCNNIDQFEEGAQKKLIFYNLITMLRTNSYQNEKDKNFLIALFISHCQLTEKLFLRYCFAMKPEGWLHSKMINFIVRIFMLKRKDIISRIDNKLYWNLNPKIRNNFIVPRLRRKILNTDVSIISSNCVGGCISHTLGLKFNSPFVNLWLYPKDFIKYCSNMEYYNNSSLSFLTKKQVVKDFGMDINYPVAKLCDIIIFFMHYETEQDARQKWEERMKRINIKNIRIIMTERDGCTIEDIKKLNELPFSKAVLVHCQMPDIPNTHYIRGFEDLGYVDNTMVYKANHYLGKMYFDDFDYVSFINNG